MTARPPDLPDFGAPPVTEVVLGVQFGSLDRLTAPHLGLVWAEFRDQFPIIEEHPPLDPVFETFADEAPRTPVPRLQFELLTSPPPPRIFFINSARTQLLQVQRDRFIHNWRKIGDGDAYPRFEHMLSTFEDGYRRFSTLIEREDLGVVVPNQCEISYINQIVISPEQKTFETFKHLLGTFTDTVILDDLGQPEDTRLFFRYVIRDNDSVPVGRLLVTALPARRLDGVSIVQFTLIARGMPTTPDLTNVRDFLTNGRRYIVRAFTQLTSAEMHRTWERRQ
jgi:uncharacterized protein (TIGR04255 family)